MKTIPLIKVNLPPAEILMPKLQETLYSGVIAEGDKVYEFENLFAQTFGLNSALAMSSGTAALHSALILSGIKNGDEVITTSMTAEPTNMAILQSGATPIFADVEVNSGNISPDSISKKITKKTKAIIVVHYAGVPVNLDEISKIARNNKITLIEDCAHALGARYDKKPIGTIGDFGIFSFQAIKHMTTIDGGILTIKNKSLIEDAKKLRWFGLEKGIPREKNDITSIGYKYNMNNVTATIGLLQLDHAGKKIDQHIENGKHYDQEFGKLPGISGASFDKYSEPSYWIYTLLSDYPDEIERILKNIGVTSSKLHKPNHYHSIFKKYANDLSNVDVFYKRMIHIPCGWWVTREDRELIIDSIRKG